MAITQVSQDALLQMARVISQSAEDILLAKQEMDEQLRSFIWDDPTGYYFTEKYNQDFKPLTDKLIPQIIEYVNYLANVDVHLSEYAGVAAIVGAMLSGFTGGRNSADTKKVPPSAPASISPKGKDIMAKEKIVSPDNDPANVGFSQDDYEKLKKRPEYKQRYDAYLSELRKRRPDLRKHITAKDIDQINSAVLNLKDDELLVMFDRLGSPETLGGLETEEHVYINRDYLEWHPESSRCGVGAIGAHESTHAAQWKKYKKIFDKAQINPSSLTLGEKKILESYPTIFKGWSEAYYDSLEEVDSRISEYAFRDACNQYAVETYYTK